MIVVHVHTDRHPAEAARAIEARLGMLRRIEPYSVQAPTILALYCDQPRAHVAGALSSLPEVVLPDMTHPEKLSKVHAEHLRKHHPAITEADTMRTAFRKLHDARPDGPLHEFNPDYF